MTKHGTTAGKSQAGFTLVELAIVMIIIGLLIGGVLKGQELIANAQVTATISQIKGLDAATSTFRDTYNALPGDILNASTRLPNCASCPSGDGNGRLNVDPGLAVGGEGLGFFRHMAAADLITGVNSEPTDATVTPGDEVPESAINGASLRAGFVATIPTGNQGGTTWRSGHYLGLGGSPLNPMKGQGTGLEGLVPSQAERIDNKLDDGLPQAGAVRAGGLDDCTATIGTAILYNSIINSAECAVFVRIQG